jgi:Bacteriophage minor capsid protein
MSAETDIIGGVVALLAPLGVPAVHKSLDSSVPRGVELILSGIGDNPKIGTGIRMLQLMFRAGGPDNTHDVDDLADQAFVLLHGVAGRMFGSVSVALIYRQSWVSLGLDDAHRWVRSDNYSLQIALVPTALVGS